MADGAFCCWSASEAIDTVNHGIHSLCAQDSPSATLASISRSSTNTPNWVTNTWQLVNDMTVRKRKKAASSLLRSESSLPSSLANSLHLLKASTCRLIRTGGLPAARTRKVRHGSAAGAPLLRPVSPLPLSPFWFFLALLRSS